MTTQVENHDAHGTRESGEHPLGGARRIMHTLGKVISLQIEIYKLKIKSAISRMLLGVCLIVAAAAVAVIAAIYLELGLFELLTDIMGLRAVWASLIIAALHLAGAAALLLAAQSVFKSRRTDKTKEDSHASRNSETRNPA